MTSTPKRPWFRFHLLTAVVLLISSGCVIASNVSIRSGVCDSSPGAWEGISYSAVYNIGWPQTFYSKWKTMAHKELINGNLRPEDELPILQVPEKAPALDIRGFVDLLPDHSVVSIECLAEDLGAAALLLALVALVCEWLIRRREARKP